MNTNRGFQTLLFRPQEQSTYCSCSLNRNLPPVVLEEIVDGEKIAWRCKTSICLVLSRSQRQVVGLFNLMGLPEISTWGWLRVMSDIFRKIATGFTQAKWPKMIAYFAIVYPIYVSISKSISIPYHSNHCLELAPAKRPVSCSCRCLEIIDWDPRYLRIDSFGRANNLS